MTFIDVSERTTLFCVLIALNNSTISIIKKARRAKKEVGKRSLVKEVSRSNQIRQKWKTGNLGEVSSINDL